MDALTKLTYDQKLLLASYYKFYGERYQKGCWKKAMAMNYLFSLKSMDVGRFDYSWNDMPYSPGMMAFLLMTERTCMNDVSMFYDMNGIHKSPVYVIKDNVLKLRGKLEIIAHKESLERWAVLLASLTYMSRSVLPGLQYETVSKELVERSLTCYLDYEMRQAWTALEKADLIILPI